MKLGPVGIKTVGTFTVKIAIVAAAALGGTALVSSSVFAALTASASNTSGGSVTTGTLILTQAPSGVTGITGGFATAITSMAPGDVVNRYVDLTSSGTLNSASMTLGASGSPSNALTTNGTAGLQVTIKECSVAWTNTGTCSGTQTTDLASASVLSLVTPASLTLQANSLLSGAVIHLQIGIALPAGSEVTVNGVLPGGTVQGLTTAVTWTFTETQRIATTTNS
ncbi:hypothetical protein MCERE85_00523 [Candidatus Nanopelagicaceae bacterium]